MALLGVGSKRPPRQEQVALLAALASLAVSGQPMASEIPKLVGKQRSLKRYLPRIRRSMTVSQILKMMHFDGHAVMLAQAGERAGKLGESLRRAVRETLAIEKLRGEMKKKVIPGLILLGVGLVSFLGMPLVVSAPLRAVKDQPSLKMPTGFWSDMVLGVDAFVRGYWWVLPLVAAILYAVRSVIWKAIKDVPPFTALRDYLVLRRSILFVAVLRPLYESGVPVREAVEQIRSGAGRADAAAYDAVLARLRAGRNLSEALDSPDWAPQLRDGMRGFEKATPEMRQEILATVGELMDLAMAMTAGRLATMMYLLGAMMALMSIAMTALGVMLPMQNIRPVR